VKISIGETRSDLSGFSTLARLAAKMDDSRLETIELDLSPCSWFDANMSAPLGVLTTASADKLNELTLTGMRQSVRTILAKNGFLTGFGHSLQPDTHGTTIPYQRFKTDDERAFAEYLEHHLKGKGIPRMSDALTRRFKASILELFTNAAMHSETKFGIFACGQYYPNKHRLDFSIADAGIGIRRKIAKELGLKMNSDKAIEWALQEGHTTRKGKIPGGLGLKLLREFITLNQGRIQIVSDRGYWHLDAGQETLTRMEHAFPGTVVNIEINTADQTSYRLRTESPP
jgi:hypothetical protein